MDVSPIYLAAMTLIGVAEWFINYDTIFLFFGVPIIAVGATVILAVCLSIIAHQHGVDLKQWKRKFGRSIERVNRPYGPLILATAGLVGLLSVVGWMRYEAVMSAIQVQPTANLLGTQISIAIDPEREIIISLGANVLAWLVGVFVSFFCHDPDPIYVGTAIDFRKAERQFLRRKHQFDRVADASDSSVRGATRRRTGAPTEAPGQSRPAGGNGRPPTGRPTRSGIQGTRAGIPA